MKAKIKNCAFYKCQKPFTPRARQKFCSAQCRKDSFNVDKKLRRNNIRNEALLENDEY